MNDINDTRGHLQAPRRGPTTLAALGCALCSIACGTGDADTDDPLVQPNLAGILTHRPAVSYGAVLDIPEETQAVVYITYPGDPRNADVSMSFSTGSVVTEVDIGNYSSRNFSYSTSSLEQPDIRYVPGEEYLFEALLQTSRIPGVAAMIASEPTDASTMTTVPELPRTSSTSNVLRHLVGVDLEVKWSTPQTYGAVVVYRAIAGQPSLPFRVYDYPDEWHGPNNFWLAALQRSKSIVIPGDVFDQEAIYMIELRPFAFSTDVREGYLTWHTYSAVSLVQLVQVGSFGL